MTDAPTPPILGKIRIEDGDGIDYGTAYDFSDEFTAVKTSADERTGGLGYHIPRDEALSLIETRGTYVPPHARRKK